MEKAKEKQKERNERGGEKMKNSIKSKRQKGITLIALVITIIVLLILAGVSIAMLTGDNGILNKAVDAGEKNKDTTEEEQVKLAVAEALTEGTGTLSTENVRQGLVSEFGADKVTDDTFTGEEAGPWTFKGERKNYEISSTGKVQEAKVPVYAKNVLLTSLDGSEDYQKSPFVQYDGRVWRVLYNDADHGLQIVTEDTVVEVALGYGSFSSDRDGTVSSSDFDVGNSDGFKCAAASYNKAVSTLNDMAKSYMNSDGICVDTRCLGYDACLENGKFKDEDDSAFEITGCDFLSDYDGKLKDGDDYYESDLGQMTKLGLISHKYEWLASRCMFRDYNGGLNFNVRSVDTDGALLTGSYLVQLWDRAEGPYRERYYGRKCGLRPVVLIGEDVVILGGYGTRERPYALGL